jgi:hypothetical protein
MKVNDIGTQQTAYVISDNMIMSLEFAHLTNNMHIWSHLHILHACIVEPIRIQFLTFANLHNSIYVRLRPSVHVNFYNKRGAPIPLHI